MTRQAAHLASGAAAQLVSRVGARPLLLAGTPVALAAQQVGQPPAEQQESAERQGVGADHPLQPGRREAQPALHRWQGQGHDRHIDHHQHLACLVLAAVATALLLGPVAYHRLVFRRGLKESLVRAASVMAIAGLATVGLAVSAAVLLVTGYVASTRPRR